MGSLKIQKRNLPDFFFSFWLTMELHLQSEPSHHLGQAACRIRGCHVSCALQGEKQKGSFRMNYYTSSIVLKRTLKTLKCTYCCPPKWLLLLLVGWFRLILFLFCRMPELLQSFHSSVLLMGLFHVLILLLKRFLCGVVFLEVIVKVVSRLTENLNMFYSFRTILRLSGGLFTFACSP